MRTISVMIAFQLLAVCLFAQEPIVQVDYEVPSPATRAVFWGSMDLISWTPHQRGMDFVATDAGGATAIGPGQLHDVNLDRDIGTRSTIGLVTRTGWGFDIAYTYFDTEGERTINRPPGVGQLFSTISHPRENDEAETATAIAALDYNVFDLTGRYIIINHEHAAVELFGGLRFADIDQNMTALYDGRDFDNAVISRESNVSAFGLRFGGVSRCRVGAGFSFFGSAACSALHGKIENHRLETDLNGGRTIVDLGNSYTQAIFNLDTALGLSWQHDNWNLSTGYEFNVWTNLGDNIRLFDNFDGGRVAGLSGDLLLDGLFVRVARAW